MKQKVLIVVDAQEDFCGKDGALTSNKCYKTALKLAKYLAKHASEYDKIICTLDTHFDNYANTHEGKILPVVHCIDGTDGHKLQANVDEALKVKDDYIHDYLENVYFAKKEQFGFDKWYELFEDAGINFVNGGNEVEYYLCGFCTDICVVSNAMILRAIQPESDMYIIRNLTAGTTQGNTNAALKTMQSCHMNVVKRG